MSNHLQLSALFVENIPVRGVFVTKSSREGFEPRRREARRSEAESEPPSGGSMERGRSEPEVRRRSETRESDRIPPLFYFALCLLVWRSLCH
jgi:hypothetical protein